MRRALVITVTLVGLLAVQAAAQAPMFDTTQFYTEAEFQAAIRPYTAAIVRSAGDAEAHYWLGVGYLHAARQFRFGLSPWASGALAQAIQSLERAVGLRATAGAMLALSEAYMMAGQREKWLALTERIAQLVQPLPLR